MMNETPAVTEKPEGWEVSREEFVAQWGALGSHWGINRTMAQVHALLMTAPAPMDSDEIMARLQISRGNANTNLRELVGWGCCGRWCERASGESISKLRRTCGKCSS